MFFWAYGIAVSLALATSFIERPFPDTVQDAPTIVRGKVGSSHTEWVNGIDGTRRIFTYFELNISDVIKGSVGPTPAQIFIRELGGEKDGMGMQVSGTAQFSPGEEIVIFLGERNDDHSYDVHGMMMGKYNLRHGTDGSDELVGPGLSFHEGGQNDPATKKKWTLQDLKTLVKSAPTASPKSNLTRQFEKKNTQPAVDASSAPSGSAPALQSNHSESSEVPVNETQDSDALPRWIWGVTIAFGFAMAFRLLSRKR